MFAAEGETAQGFVSSFSPLQCHNTPNLMKTEAQGTESAQSDNRFLTTRSREIRPCKQFSLETSELLTLLPEAQHACIH